MKKYSDGPSFQHVPPLFWRGVCLILGASALVFAIDNATVAEPSRPIVGLLQALIAINLLLYGVFGWRLEPGSLFSAKRRQDK